MTGDRTQTFLYSGISTQFYSSKRLRNLPRLPHPRHRIPHLPPTHGEHHVARLAARHDDAQVVPRRGEVVEALVAEGDDLAADDVADAEHVIHDDAVLLDGAHVLLADEPLEAQLVGAVLVLRVSGGGEDGGDVVVVGGGVGGVRVGGGGRRVVEHDEDGDGRLALLDAGDACQDDRIDGGEGVVFGPCCRRYWRRGLCRRGGSSSRRGFDREAAGTVELVPSRTRFPVVRS